MQAFIASLDGLLKFLATHFFVHPERQQHSDLRLCLYPDLNVDRGGPGTKESMASYDRFQAELDEAAMAVRDAYKDYRFAVKQSLAL